MKCMVWNFILLHISDLEAVTDDQTSRITAAEENIQGERILFGSDFQKQS